MEANPYGELPYLSLPIVFGNTSGDGGGCTITTCCAAGDPMLTPTYRLMSSSTACIGRLASTMAAPDDIDGQIRVNGQPNDCGADEF